MSSLLGEIVLIRANDNNKVVAEKGSIFAFANDNVPATAAMAA